MSLAQAQAKLDLAVTANEAESYSDALKYLRSAEIYLKGIPDSSHNGAALSLRDSLQELRNDIYRAKKEQEMAARGGGGIGLVNLSMRNATTTST